MIDYLVYDVFTDRAFGGNPLAVIPDARGLAEDQLQQVAREFNFSETTFVYPPEAGGDAKVRIFTPAMEIPFAGHPTVGTALALHNLGKVGTEIMLELGVGPIPVSISGQNARFVTKVPLETWPGPPVDVIAASIGQPESAIRTDRHAPTIGSVGLPFALAELVDDAALSAALPNTDAFRAFDPHWPGQTHYDLLVYTRSGNRINARMFAPLDGIPEDPATGSAAAALSAFLGQLEGQSSAFEINQGITMGRPSRIEAEVIVEDGHPTSVAIAGSAVKVMEGRLAL